METRQLLTSSSQYGLLDKPRRFRELVAFTSEKTQLHIDTTLRTLHRLPPLLTIPACAYLHFPGVPPLWPFLPDDCESQYLMAQSGQRRDISSDRRQFLNTRTMRMKIATNVTERDRVRSEKSRSARAAPTFMPIVAKPPIKNSAASNKNRTLTCNFTRCAALPWVGLSDLDSNCLPHPAHTAILLV